jgi:WD40 repeat protein
LGICIDPIDDSLAKHQQKQQQQRYMSGHTDDVLSITIWNPPSKKKRGGGKGRQAGQGENESRSGGSGSGNGHETVRRNSIVATGEIGKTPKIIIWDPETMEIINIIKGAHTRGVVQLGFSPNGNILASIGLDNQNSLILHHWKKEGNTGLLIKIRTGGHKVFGLAWHTNHTLVSCGHRHMKFWKRGGENNDGHGLDSSSARFGKELAGETSKKVTAVLIVLYLLG